MVLLGELDERVALGPAIAPKNLGRDWMRGAAFTPLHRANAPQVSNTKVLSALKRHKCRAPITVRAPESAVSDGR